MLNVIKLNAMKNNQTRFLQYSQRVLRSLGSAYDVAHMFGWDYSNTKKMYRDFNSIPISKAFQILDYANADLVVFRSF